MKIIFAKLLSLPLARGGLYFGISLLSLFLALKDVSLRDVGAAFVQADLRFVGLALLSVALNTAAKTWRWQVLLGPAGRPVGFMPVLMALLSGQMLNLLYPGRVGDLSRAYVIGGMGIGRSFTLGTVALEKLLDMVLYALLIGFTLVLIPLPDWLGGSIYGVAGLSLTLILFSLVLSYQQAWVVALLTRLFHRLPESWRKVWVGRFQSALSSLNVLRSRADLLKLALWSAMIWTTAVLNNYLILLALRLTLPAAAPALVLAALQAGIVLPGVPGRIGIFQYACVLALSVFGIDRALGFTYGVLLHSVVMVPSTLVGLACFGLLGLSGKRSEILRVS